MRARWPGVCTAILLLPAVAAARTIHVAPSGSDDAGGSELHPLRTIQRCADVAEPGDTCRVRAGVYRETVRPPRSGTEARPVRFEAAPGECVTVSGAEPLEVVWEQVEEGQFAADTELEFVQLFSRGSPLPEARWPNGDAANPFELHAARSLPGSTVHGLTVPELPPGNWTGARVFVLPGEGWVSGTRTVASYDASSRVLTFDREMQLDEFSGKLAPRGNDPFYLFGALPALDAPGEWVLDRSHHKLYFMPPVGEVPGDLELEYKSRAHAFDVAGRDWLEFSGFRVFGATLRFVNVSHVTVNGIKAEYVAHTRDLDGYATKLDEPSLIGSDNVWSNGVIGFSGGNGLTVGGSNNRVLNNVIHDSGYLGANGAGLAFAAGHNPSNVLAYNTVNRTGRAGIALQNSRGSRVLWNRVRNATLMGNDGGGIGGVWTWNGQSTEVAYNEISEVHSNPGYGIYLDDAVTGFIVHHNYIHDVPSHGIIIKGENTLFNNTVQRALGPLHVMSNVYTGKSDGLERARLVNNLSDDRSALTFGLRLSTTAPGQEFMKSVAVNGEWTRVELPFSQLELEPWAPQRDLDLTQATHLVWTPGVLGAFEFELDNVRFEGSRPALFAEFESSLVGAWAGGGDGSSAKLEAVQPGAAGSRQAARVTGEDIGNGWALLVLNLEAAGKTLDLSHFTSVSFDVRGSARPRYATEKAVPVQTNNASCPLTDLGTALEGCGIDGGIRFGTGTAGFNGAAPDLGAFEQGSARWKSGASFEPEWESCAVPSAPDLVLPPLPELPPLGFAGAGGREHGEAAGNSGQGPGIGSAGSAGELSDPPAGSSDSGCGCSLPQMQGSGRPPLLAASALALVALLLTRRRAQLRAKCRSAARR
jgi:MYXO-CTERM domain-containing protein